MFYPLLQNLRITLALEKDKRKHLFNYTSGQVTQINSKKETARPKRARERDIQINYKKRDKQKTTTGVRVLG